MSAINLKTKLEEKEAGVERVSDSIILGSIKDAFIMTMKLFSSKKKPVLVSTLVEPRQDSSGYSVFCSVIYDDGKEKLFRHRCLTGIANQKFALAYAAFVNTNEQHAPFTENWEQVS